MYPDNVMHLMLTHDFAFMSTLTPLRRLKSFVLSFVRLYASVSDMSRWMKLERPLMTFVKMFLRPLKVRQGCI